MTSLTKKSKTRVLFGPKNRVCRVPVVFEREMDLGPGVAPRSTSHERNVLTNGVHSRSTRPFRPPSKGRVVNKKSVALIGGLAAVFVVVGASPAFAIETTPSLSGVIDNLRVWVVGLLAALATLFLTIGGVRYMLAGGDPGQVERAKSALKSAAVGYALAALSPILVGILKSVVGA